MTKYEITHPDLTLWVWYRGGTVAKLQVRRGSFAKHQAAWPTIAKWVPKSETDIEAYAERWPAIQYKRQGANRDAPSGSLYKYLVSDWFMMYFDLFRAEYRFSGVDGKAMKGIEKHLVSAYGDDARATWQALLSRWNELPDFYRKKADLAFVNAKLNEIIAHLNTNEQAESEKDNIRRSL